MLIYEGFLKGQHRDPVCACKYSTQDGLSLVEIFLHPAYKIIGEGLNGLIRTLTLGFNFSLLPGCDCLNKS
jgi:hypothetical protein